MQFLAFSPMIPMSFVMIKFFLSRSFAFVFLQEKDIRRGILQDFQYLKTLLLHGVLY